MTVLHVGEDGVNPLGPIADISVMVSHKLMGIYMGVLLLGVIL